MLERQRVLEDTRERRATRLADAPVQGAADLDRLERLAHRMDSLFRIPGLNIRVGLDSLLGLIPGVGDALSLAPAAYIVAQGRRMGAPAHVQARMVANIGVDALIGAVPLVGDLFDVGWKANTRNVALIRQHVNTKNGASFHPRRAQR